MPVSVELYDPDWVKWFEEIRAPIWEKISEYAVDMVHVGSTSIPDMSAKPIIDIDIVLDDWAIFPQIVEQLATFGYRHIGDLGIKEREAFKLDSEPEYPHNLYVCHKDSVAYRNHVLLKKHLTENPRDFTRYQELKLGLSESAENVDEYCRAKTDLILEILAKEGVPDEDLEQIRSENLS
jgi:GrpB-like predicted nucleotidyltransferase (UPF0157 family)